MSKLDYMDFKSALKQDFDALYVPAFTADWKEQRLLRQIEIDIMEFPVLEALLKDLSSAPKVNQGEGK